MKFKRQEKNGISYYSVKHLEDVQQEMLRLFKIVDSICKKNGLSYWIDGGTLLGGIRHGGFIPWDDDLDICLLKDDYDLLIKKLAEYCQTVQDSFLFYHNTKFNYWCDYLGSTKYCRVDKYGDYMPLRIDIFPVKTISDTTESVVAHRFWGDVAGVYYYGKARFNKNLEKVKYHIENEVLIQKKLIFEFYNDDFMAQGVKQYESTKNLLLRKAHGNFAPLEHISYDNVFPLTHLEFEGYSVFAPNNCESYLNASYRNWRDLPKISKRKPVFSYVSTSQLSKEEVVEIAHNYMSFLETWFLKRNAISYRIRRTFDLIRHRFSIYTRRVL